MAHAPLIAVVDDDRSFREALVGMMGAFGYNAEAHASGHDVLESDKLSRFSAFVLDVQMPEMSGLELQRRIRDRGLATPIIFVSGSRDRAVRAKAVALGATAMLDKPFDGDELIACLEAALRPQALGCDLA